MPDAADTSRVWPLERRSILDWLVRHTQGERYIDNILVELCFRLRDEGIPVARCTLHFRTHHPEWLGARILWRYPLRDASITNFDYGVEQTDEFRLSPANEIYAGRLQVRANLEALDDQALVYPLYLDLAAEGLTDYVAWPVEHTLGKRHVLTFASDRPGGFLPEHIVLLQDLLPAITLISEIRLKNVISRTLLDTYVGPHASEEILAGATRRGSGRTIAAAIMICDLRNFTEISSHWPRDTVIELLNAYFDAICDPVEKHGGEVLKFIGDGMLAVFPLSDVDACTNLVCAVREGYRAMTATNASNMAKGLPKLDFGVGVHIGDVAYGNIGSRKRLDFTVIGPAVNIAARIEALTKETGNPILVSQEFADRVGCDCAMTSVGEFRLRGWDVPVMVSQLHP